MPKQWKPVQRVTLSGATIYRHFSKWDRFQNRQREWVEAGQKDDLCVLIHDRDRDGELVPYVVNVTIPAGVSAPEGLKLGSPVTVEAERREYGSDARYTALSVTALKAAS